MAARTKAPRQGAQDLVITRVFDAPRELVWKAWTEPEHFKQWWGPKDFTCPFSKIDLRVGGAYLWRMRSPEGQDFWTTGVYREIVPLKRLVYTDSFADADGNVVPPSHYGMTGDWPPEAVVTVTFEEDRGRTKMTLRHAGLPAGEHSEMAGAGWNESFDKLAASLAAGSRSPEGRGGQGVRTTPAPDTADREIVLTRVVDAPREVVFQAWTDRKHVGQWWGPNGFTTTTHEMDVRPGGVWRFIMHGPDGTDYQNKIVYLEVVQPERLVYRHTGEAGTEDVRFTTTVTFQAEGGKTRVTLRSVFESAAERDRVEKEYGAIEGGKQTLERLAEYVTKMGRARA